MEENDVAYLNIDLDLYSTQEPVLLRQAFGEGYTVMCDEAHDSGFLLTLEGSSLAHPDSCLEAFCSRVEAFDADTRAEWDACRRRVFDIGFESGSGELVLQATLQPDTLARLAALGAAVTITIYPQADAEGHVEYQELERE